MYIILFIIIILLDVATIVYYISGVASEKRPNILINMNEPKITEKKRSYYYIII